MITRYCRNAFLCDCMYNLIRSRLQIWNYHCSISIKNISIIHNREFDEGVLAIEFYELEPMKKAVELLRHHRYMVWDND